MAALPLVLALALVSAWPGIVGPWVETASHEGMEVRLIHPSLWSRWTTGLRGSGAESDHAPLSDRLEVADLVHGSVVTAAEYPIYDTAEDGVSGLSTLWHRDSSRVVCLFDCVGFGCEPASAYFMINRDPLSVKMIEKGEWVLEALPPEVDGLQ